MGVGSVVTLEKLYLDNSSSVDSVDSEVDNVDIYEFRRMFGWQGGGGCRGPGGAAWPALALSCRHRGP